MLAMLTLSFASSMAQTLSVPLVWDPSPDAATPGRITGYKLYYAPHSFTNLIPGTPTPPSVRILSTPHTGVTAIGLIPGFTYHFAVTAVDASGAESEFSNTATFLIPGTVNPPPPTHEDPPPPNSGGSGFGGTTFANLVGLLPRLLLAPPTNGHPTVTLYGALGATFAVQTSSGMSGTEQWTTVTNIKLTTIAPNFVQPAGGALVKAFIPAVQTWQDTNSNTSAGPQFYRIIMPHGYAIIADEVLETHGYYTRLIAVRLAGLDAEIACYVSEEGAFLHYDDDTFFVRFESSGATIRQIADKLATVLQQNWTSASEFTVTDGLKQILATVVKTDDPSLDPPLGSSGGVNIAIDF